MVGPLHQQMAKPASKVPRAAVVLATTLAPAQGKQDKAATTLQSQRENVGASVAGPASEAPSAAAVPATVLAPVQGKHDKAAATLQSQPEKAPRRKCLLNEHTTTSLSRDQVLTIKRAIRAASTEEEVEELEKAILNGVMPRGLRSQAGCVAAKAASSSGEALAPAQGKEGPYQVHPDSRWCKCKGPNCAGTAMKRDHCKDICDMECGCIWLYMVTNEQRCNVILGRSALAQELGCPGWCEKSQVVLLAPLAKTRRDQVCTGTVHQAAPWRFL